MRTTASRSLMGALLGAGWLAATATGAESTVLNTPDPATVVIVDRSGSMWGGYNWLAELMVVTDTGLNEHFGTSSASQRYGLVGFVPTLSFAPLGESGFGSVQSIGDALRKLRTVRNGFEDGYWAISHTLGLAHARAAPDRPLEILLVTDEDRDRLDPKLDIDALTVELAFAETVLDVIVNVRFRCGNGDPAFGLNAQGRGLTMGVGQLAYCRDVHVSPGRHIPGTDEADSSIRDYVDLALASGGTAWSIEWARGDDRRHVNADFARAFAQARIERQSARLDDLPIMASAHVQPARLRVHEVVTLDGSDSRPRDPTMTVDSWRWDFDGDGRFDDDGPVVATIFDTPGRKVVTLRVGDRSTGLAAETHIAIQVDVN